MIIRLATIDDIAAIHRVYLAAAEDGDVSESNWIRLIGEGGMFVAETGNDIIGFGGIDVTAVEQIKWLYVKPELQRAGVGARILAELERRGWDSGHNSLRLHANPPAIEFYRRQGYEELEAGQQIGHDHDGLEMIKYRT